MYELIQFAFSPINMVYTFLLFLVVLYWFMVIVGAMDIASMDIDFDLDVDVDVDADASSGGAGDIAGGLSAVLHYFNFGRIPFMVIMSFVILFCWALSILFNFYIGSSSILLALVFIVPNLFIGLCLTKMITTPLIPVFDKMEGGIEPVDYIGMICKIVLPPTMSKMGQAEVLIEDSPLLINVKMDNSTGNLKKGEEGVVLRKEKNKPYYIIKKEDHSNL